MNDPVVERKLYFLIDILNNEIEMLKKIKLVETEKNLLLTKKKLVDLSPQNEQLETLVKEETVFEQRREAILKELTLFFKEKEKLTLKTLMKYLSENFKAELENIRNQIQELSQEIKYLNEVNRVILMDLIKLIEYTIDGCVQEKNLETNYGDRNKKKTEHRSILVNRVI